MMRSLVPTHRNAKRLRQEMSPPEMRLWMRLRRRDAYLQSKGIRVYRIAARTVLEDPDWVAYGLIALASEIIASRSSAA